MTRLLVLLLALVLAPMARATTVLDLPVERLAKESPVVVEATVVSRTSEWNAERTRIETRTTLAVTRSYKEEMPKEIVLRQASGEVDGIVFAIPGDAAFVKGEKVLVFLEPHPSGEGFVLFSMAASKFRLEKNEAVRDIENLGFASPGPDGLIRSSEAPKARFQLDELRAALTRALR